MVNKSFRYVNTACNEKWWLGTLECYKKKIKLPSTCKSVSIYLRWIVSFFLPCSLSVCVYHPDSVYITHKMYDGIHSRLHNIYFIQEATLYFIHFYRIFYSLISRVAVIIYVIYSTYICLTFLWNSIKFSLTYALGT